MDPAPPPPPGLAVYLCPARPCPTYATSMHRATTHLLTHPTYDHVQRDFGTHGLESLISRARLMPALSQSRVSVLVCIECCAIFPTVSAAESHLGDTPVHAEAVAAQRASHGDLSLRYLLRQMRLVEDETFSQHHQQQQQQQQTPEGQQQPIEPEQHRAPPPHAPTGKVTLRIVLGPNAGIAFPVPRLTALAVLSVLVQRKIASQHDWDHEIDWDREIASMAVRYASLKHNGQTATMRVRGEEDWKRVMRDAVSGARVEWKVGVDG